MDFISLVLLSNISVTRLGTVEMFSALNYNQTEIVVEAVAAIEVEHHLQVTCQTLAETSAGGQWVELRLIPLACWIVLFPNNQRMV